MPTHIEGNQRIEVAGTVYSYHGSLEQQLTDLYQRVNVFRTLVGTLQPAAMQKLRDTFRLKDIYNSNAIEGNTLTMGETQMVIAEGMTITGRPLRDSIEARNLNYALDFFHELADREGQPLTTRDLRTIHGVILKGIDDRNAGVYRSVQVKIGGSATTPPEPAKVQPEMDAFGQWLESVSVPSQNPDVRDPLVLACAAHAWFVYIHPFIDGNGRTARLLMNLILMRYGYPLTIITKSDCQRYYDALQESQSTDLTPFIRLVMESALESIETYEDAGKEQLEIEQFARKLIDANEERFKPEYEVFQGAMKIFIGAFRQVTEAAGTDAPRLAIKDFGILEYEKYHTLRQGQSAKQTWFFRLTVYREGQDPSEARRFMFWFGCASRTLGRILGDKAVTLYVSAETYPYYYERLSELPTADQPDVHEVGYLASEERFVYLDAAGQTHTDRAEAIAKRFIEVAYQLK